MSRDNIEKTLEFLQSLEREGTISPNDYLVPPGERECPICKKKMVVEVQEGASVDVCREHGIWLDFGELDEILSRIRRGGEINQRYAIRRAIEEDRKMRPYRGG